MELTKLEWESVLNANDVNESFNPLNPVQFFHSAPIPWVVFSGMLYV
jgi:hypothetical protein